MAVPSQGDLHRPLLEIAAENVDALSNKQFLESIKSRYSLTLEDLNERVPSGDFRVRVNRDFALHSLTTAGLLCRPSRGHFQITAVGRDYLKNSSGPITNAQLNGLTQLQRPEGGSVRPSMSPSPPASPSSSDAGDTSPQDKIEAGHRELNEQLVDDLLDSISRILPDAFERLVVDLLEKMGYGKGEAIGRSSDGGIDGIINQDALGLEKVYMQAKRWHGQVGEPEIRNFSGSLDARGASKGVFVTTSSFSGNAKQTGQIISAGNKFIRLIDGPELAKLMLAHEVGVITQYTYRIQKLDENYFAEES